MSPRPSAAPGCLHVTQVHMYIEFLSPCWAFFLMDWHSAGIQKAALQEGAILWRDLKDIRGSLEADLPNLLASSGEKKKEKTTKNPLYFLLFNKAFPRWTGTPIHEQLKPCPSAKQQELQQVLLSSAQAPGRRGCLIFPQTRKKAWNLVALSILKPAGNYKLLAKHASPLAELFSLEPCLDLQFQQRATSSRCYPPFYIVWWQ